MDAGFYAAKARRLSERQARVLREHLKGPRPVTVRAWETTTRELLVSYGLIVHCTERGLKAKRPSKRPRFTGLTRLGRLVVLAAAEPLTVVDVPEASVQPREGRDANLPELGEGIRGVAADA